MITAKTVTYLVGLVAAFGTGMAYQSAFNTPTPCIENLHTSSHPWFARYQQEMLENNRDVLLAVVNHESHTGTTYIVRGESWMTDDKEYFVPHNCYATDLDNWNGPILWRNDD